MLMASALPEDVGVPSVIPTPLLLASRVAVPEPPIERLFKVTEEPRLTSAPA
jgi:hypothetical protein